MSANDRSQGQPVNDLVPSQLCHCPWSQNRFHEQAAQQCSVVSYSLGYPGKSNLLLQQLICPWQNYFVKLEMLHICKGRVQFEAQLNTTLCLLPCDEESEKAPLTKGNLHFFSAAATSFSQLLRLKFSLHYVHTTFPPQSFKMVVILFCTCLKQDEINQLNISDMT